MPLAPGTQLGRYEITAQLGVGGMGEVYRASDPRLKRDVALKVLPETFANDANRMARFEREAQVLAALNHTNIASIHGLEESNGIGALVMELVEGVTLEERIAAGPIPFDEALPIAKQIAEALNYAHEHGIMHRDLKPANIKVTQDAAAKVLDFGLAKALAGDVSDTDISKSPTISIAATRLGMILGTAAYMSPEQARGRTVDKRTEIVAGRLIPVGKETDRRWEQGEDPSMLDSEIYVFEKQGKMAVADFSDRKKWRAGGVRSAIRKSGLSPTTVYAILNGEPVRIGTLATFKRAIER
jgi:serine/threonine protein kinase